MASFREEIARRDVTNPVDWCAAVLSPSISSQPYLLDDVQTYTEEIGGKCFILSTDDLHVLNEALDTLAEQKARTNSVWPEWDTASKLGIMVKNALGIAVE